MMGKEVFKNKYRIKSARLDKWDYSRDGYYFVTICTKNQKEYFGKIKGIIMNLSEIGKIVCDELLKTPVVRKNVLLDEWIVMPNHVHVIFEIKNKIIRRDAPVGRLYDGGMNLGNEKWKSQSLGAIVNQFKSVCTKRIRKAGFQEFAWHARFYDHIVRNRRSLQQIRKYIQQNSIKWDEDENNPKKY